MSLLGIVLGIAFFIVTQAQTSGFEAFFIRTILGTNGAIRISDRFQDMHGTVRSSSKDGRTKFLFNSREGARYTEGIENPILLRNALDHFPQISGISEILQSCLAFSLQEYGRKEISESICFGLQKSNYLPSL